MPRWQLPVRDPDGQKFALQRLTIAENSSGKRTMKIDGGQVDVDGPCGEGSCLVPVQPDPAPTTVDILTSTDEDSSSE